MVKESITLQRLSVLFVISFKRNPKTIPLNISSSDAPASNPIYKAAQKL